MIPAPVRGYLSRSTDWRPATPQTSHPSAEASPNCGSATAPTSRDQGVLRMLEPDDGDPTGRVNAGACADAAPTCRGPHSVDQRSPGAAPVTIERNDRSRRQDATRPRSSNEQDGGRPGPRRVGPWSPAVDPPHRADDPGRAARPPRRRLKGDSAMGGEGHPAADSRGSRRDQASGNSMPCRSRKAMR
jgi:hypothetical protein